MDAVVLSTTFMETSRLHPTRIIDSIKGRKKRDKRISQAVEQWSEIICPPYRSLQAVQIFELPAMSCAHTSAFACYCFEGGS